MTENDASDARPAIRIPQACVLRSLARKCDATAPVVAQAKCAFCAVGILLAAGLHAGADGIAAKTDLLASAVGVGPATVLAGAAGRRVRSRAIGVGCRRAIGVAGAIAVRGIVLADCACLCARQSRSALDDGHPMRGALAALNEARRCPPLVRRVRTGAVREGTAAAGGDG